MKVHLFSSVSHDEWSEYLGNFCATFRGHFDNCAQNLGPFGQLGLSEAVRPSAEWLVAAITRNTGCCNTTSFFLLMFFGNYKASLLLFILIVFTLKFDLSAQSSPF